LQGNAQCAGVAALRGNASDALQQQQLITASVFFVLACVDCRDCSVGHKGKFGHEFLEFEFRPDGLLRYANNSNYKRDTMIRVR